MTHEDVKKGSENGRKFISSLIELTAADVSVTVQEKVSPGEVVEVEEKYTEDGKTAFIYVSQKR